MTFVRVITMLAISLLGAGPVASAGEPPAVARAAGGTAHVLEIDGAIGPATASYVSDSLRTAAEQDAALVILRVDTPGGLDTSMREIIRAILASPVPVVSYVNPGGARAASAGTYILYASHVAAMTPGTNLGAATPVQLGGLPGTGNPQASTPSEEIEAKSERDQETTQKNSPAAPKDAHEAKAINDAVAYIRSLAEMRGRNVAWAERAVREAASLPATEALKENVIDIVAPDMGNLLTQMDGRTVTVNGAETTLATSGLTLESVKPDWRTEVLNAITNPNVALILMMIGVYGLFFEFAHPGAVYPGTIGAICLLVGLYALAALPVNAAGAALMLLGLALIIAEAFVPSFGALGIGGIVAFILGATILIDTDAPGFTISLPIIGGTSAATLLFVVVVARMAISSYRRKVVSGREQLIGSMAVVQDWEGTAGHVFVHGERWNAVSNTPLTASETAHISSVDGLTLQVMPETHD